MKINAIITGSTGMVGKAVLLECLKSNEVNSVLVINRKPVGITHEKLKEVIHPDLSDISSIQDELKGYDTCFFCAGISSAGLSEIEYHRITYELTLDFANTLLAHVPGIAFFYISGAGTDSSEKGRMMWARVKGKTENALLAMEFSSAYMFRPGFIIPMRGLRSRTPMYNSLYRVMKPFFPLMRKFPAAVTDSEKLGMAMIYVALHGYDKQILESSDINKVIKDSLPKMETPST